MEDDHSNNDNTITSDAAAAVLGASPSSSSHGDVCDVAGCAGLSGVVMWKCHCLGCPHVVHHVCAIEQVACADDTFFCSATCKAIGDNTSTAASSPSPPTVPTTILPGAEFTTFEDLQAAIRDDGAKVGVKINQRQTHLMDDRALVIFGHKAIQRGVFYCSQLHCPFTLRFSYDFTKMRYAIRHSSFHGTHNHGVKNSLHARGKGVPFDKEFITLDALADGVDRFQCRHCRAIVLKKVARLGHLKDCAPYRQHVASGHARDNGDAADDDDDNNPTTVADETLTAEFRTIPADGKTSSRLECKHCSAHLKRNRLLTHLRDCAAYQGLLGHLPLTNPEPLVATSFGMLQRPRSDLPLECRRLESDADLAALHALRSATVPSVTSHNTSQDVAHWGLFDHLPAAKRPHAAHPPAITHSPSLVGVFAVRREDVNLFGARVSVGVLARVATDLLHPPIDKTAVGYFLRECVASRAALALVPASSSASMMALYRAMGFTPTAPSYQFTFPPSAIPPSAIPAPLVTHLDASVDAADVLECLVRVCATRHGSLYPTSVDALFGHHVIGCRDLRGILRGFVAFDVHEARLDVHHLVYEDARTLGGLLGVLAHQPVALIVLAAPLVRLVHVPDLFATHFATRNFNFVTGLVLHLVVRDPLQPAPTTLLVRFDSGVARVVVGAVPHDVLLQLHVADATALLLGAVSLLKLVQYGKASLTPHDVRTTRLLARAFDVDVPPTLRF
ncbi:Aste57867_23891 [Aphanomyces stellatus]|uniref:Aste57867_23891 protein n=1 Tax=Aphanomyces stellatus TaxID=120398 RepID=A0A485LP84_9STRA|nr:hypothetical protein As57867_023818 [Aphanomyces stellatus]VFU00534.1 Aste57867_23891 [Aphanomyces stellatus]